MVVPTSVQPPPLPSLPDAPSPAQPEPEPFVNVQVSELPPSDDLADMPPTDNAVVLSTAQLSSTNTNDNSDIGAAIVSQSTQATEDEVVQDRREVEPLAPRRTRPSVPSLVGNYVGESLSVSMLSMAGSEGFKNTLIYGKRGG